jgi:hypothetical protein
VRPGGTGNFADPADIRGLLHLGRIRYWVPVDIAEGDLVRELE